MLFMKMSASPIIFFAMARPSSDFKLREIPVLVGVVEVDGRILGVGQIAAEARTLRALDIAVERFDLQNFGAHFGQYSDGCGSCDVRAHLDHFDARKRAVAIEFLSDGIRRFSFPLCGWFSPVVILTYSNICCHGQLFILDGRSLFLSCPEGFTHRFTDLLAICRAVWVQIDGSVHAFG